MKRVLIIMMTAGVLTACNNNADTARSEKDSLDSVANVRKDNIDSIADMRTDRIDSLTELRKDRIDSLNRDTTRNY
jgi:PBP1b-binding outer membrane lipoprotein LpoB